MAVGVATLLCHAETCVLHRRKIRLERFHQSCLCSGLRIRWLDHVSNEGVLKRASLPSIQSILQHRWAGHVTRMEDVHMPKAIFFSELQEGKRDRGAPRKRYKDRLRRQLPQAGISHQLRQQEAPVQDSWRSSVRKTSCRFEAERHEAAKEKRRRQKRASSIPPLLIPNLRLSLVQYGVRIKNRSLQPPTIMQELTINLPSNPRLRGMSYHLHHGVSSCHLYTLLT